MENVGRHPEWETVEINSECYKKYYRLKSII